MYCVNCGKEIDGQAKNCPYCGAEQKTGAVRAKAGGTGSSPFKDKKLLGIAGGAVAVVALVLIFMLSGKPTINLDDYVTVEFEGYNTVGHARVTVDEDRFYEENLEDLEISDGTWEKMEDMAYESSGSDSELAAFLVGRTMQAIQFLSDREVAGMFFDEVWQARSLTPSSDLSNGDTVVFAWALSDGDKELLEELFGVKIKFGEPKEFTVEGLEEPEKIDPFEGVEVTFSGIAPNGEATLDASNGPESCQSLYELDPQEGLSNGDTVTLYLDRDDVNEYLTENYGVVVSETSKTYTVEGLASYAASLDEIPEETAESMRKQSEDVIRAEIAGNSDMTLDELSYLGDIMLTPKVPGTMNKNNVLYNVYHTRVTITRGENTTNAESYVWVGYYDLTMLADGTCSVDLSDYDLTGSYIRVPLGVLTYRIPGFENYETLFSNTVTTNIADWNYETDIAQ